MIYIATQCYSSSNIIMPNNQLQKCGQCCVCACMWAGGGLCMRPCEQQSWLRSGVGTGVEQVGGCSGC